MFEQSPMNDVPLGGREPGIEVVSGQPKESEQQARKIISGLVSNNQVDRIEVVGGKSFEISDETKIEAQKEIFAALVNGGEINIHWVNGSYSPSVTMETIGGVVAPDQEDSQVAA